MEQEKTLENIRENILSLIGAFTFSFLTALGAHIKIPLPFTPVPVTFQVFFVLLSGAILGKEGGTISQLLYLAFGSIGLPFFASGGGALYLFGPTGGYLFGFVVASYITGYLIRKFKSSFSIFFSMLISLLAIYFFGVIHLSLFLHISLWKGIKIGALPFVGIDIVKILIAFSVVYFYNGRRER